jgi:catalase
VLSGAAGHYDSRAKDDFFTQPGNLFRLLKETEKKNLFDNLAKPLSQVDEPTRMRQLALFDRADPGYGKGVRDALRARGITFD